MLPNKFLFLTMLSACAYAPVAIFAESLPSDIKINPKDKRIKPHDTSGTVQECDIECTYLSGIISLTFSEPEGMAKVYIYDMSVATALLAIHTINTATTATIAVPTAPGFYRIAITTSLNNQYEGFYTVF